MRVGRTGRGVAAGVLLLACIAAGCAASGNGASPEDELPEFSAGRLGDSGSGSLADDELSPAERDAARDSWAHKPPMRDPLDDPAEDDPFAEPEVPKPEEPPKGPFGRAMDATGRFFVSVASVTLTLGMAIAPLFAMFGA
jgi:hypothetical protein